MTGNLKMHKYVLFYYFLFFYVISIYLQISISEKYIYNFILLEFVLIIKISPVV